MRKRSEAPTDRTVGLDYVVTSANADAPLAARVEWLEHLIGWVRNGSGAETAEEAGGPSPAVRLKFLLQVVDRHPDRKADIARCLRATIAESNALMLLCETGLPRANAFLQEFGRRVTARLLPAPPAADDMAALFHRVFPDEADAEWVAALPDETLDGLAALWREGAAGQDIDPWHALRRDADDALLVLASHAQAIGLSGRVWRRTATGRPLDSPFADLVGSVREYIVAPRGTEEFDAARAALSSAIARCRRALADVMGHLESYGVSTDLVYQLERARLALKRMEVLAALRGGEDAEPHAAARFAARLIRANARQDSIGTLLRENGRLLARRVVESARRTGEHYITHDAGEYRAMLASAAIGGAVTAITVLVKFASVGHALPLFVEGLAASLNYALSFVAIHLLHGTLATKQPAMTAATMAAKLNVAKHRGRLREFVDEVAHLVRSQSAAIAGNLLLVAPAAVLIYSLVLVATGTRLPDHEHALHYIEALSPLGPTLVYAAFTGVLLWLSAVAAGWFENWATYRRLPESIAQSSRLVAWLGPERAKAFAGGVERNVAALGGNVALGFMLGMAPVIAAFFGVPLEVRHVTLSTGQLAVASLSEGAGVFGQAAFWFACAGIVVIGFLNLAVSFGLALWVAIWSTGAGAVSRRRLRRALLARLVANPRDFLLPPRSERRR